MTTIEERIARCNGCDVARDDCCPGSVAVGPGPFGSVRARERWVWEVETCPLGKQAPEVTETEEEKCDES